MKRPLYSTFIFFSLIFLCSGNKAPMYDACRVYGVAYIEEDPNRAHFRVYEEETEAFADLIVYEEQNRLYADKVGIWNFTENRDFADFYVYFEESKGLSDFSVYFTDFESFAGCNR